MSENTNIEQEQTVQEEVQTPVEETAQEAPAKEEAKKDDKKGFLKKGNKDKARIEELEKKVTELEGRMAKATDDYL